MGKKSNYKTWYDYNISMHMGFCHGPIDALMGVYMKEKPVWEGELTANGFVDVDKPNLFGGEEREGGAVGRVHFMRGDFTQLIPGELASRLGRTPETSPGYRGLFSLFFCGNGTIGRPGFKVGSNYPSVPGIWARVRRSSKTTLNPAYARIPYEPGNRLDANPSHMIWEILTDTDWGMGGLPQQLDVPSFNYAAQKLFEEKFGLSMLWMRQTTIEAFIQEIIDHIQALFFFHPRTGLGTLKLLRDDYDPNSLPEIGPDQARLKNFRRKLWGETTNEIIVSWTNPETEEQETVSYQDLANIAMQGEVVSENRNYYGIRNVELATRIAARDIGPAATPLATATIEVDRRHWDFVPGDMIKFTWPKYNIERLLMRVMEVDYGKPDDAKLTMNLMEDIFGLSQAVIITPPPPTQWEPVDQDPNSSVMLNIPGVFAAIPYSLIQQIMGEDAMSDDLYPAIVIAVMVSRTNLQPDLQQFRLNGVGVLPNGATTWYDYGRKNLTGYSTLSEALPREVTSEIILGSTFGGGEGPEIGGLGLISKPLDSEMDPGAAIDGNERDWELVLFDEDLGNGTWRVIRGALDTVPRAWTRGSVIRFLGVTFDAWDANQPLANSSVTYKLTAITSLGESDINKVNPQSTSRLARPYFPYRPANVRVNGSLFDEIDLSHDYGPRNWECLVTWANRNRKTEDTIYRRWDESDVPAENGQTTVVELWWFEVIESVVVWHHVSSDDITGSSLAIDVAKTGAGTDFLVRTKSKRDGFESLQYMEHSVKFYRKGFGSDYGYFYGGWGSDVEV